MAPLSNLSDGESLLANTVPGFKCSILKAQNPRPEADGTFLILWGKQNLIICYQETLHISCRI